MNKIFKTIWSDALGAWVVVSEITKSHKGGGSSSSRKTFSASQTALWQRGVGAIIGLLMASFVATSFVVGTPAPATAATVTLVNGQDIYTNGLNANPKQYDLLLGGDVTWNSTFTMLTATPDITIDGNGKNINLSVAGTAGLLTINKNNSNVAITNATVTAGSFTGTRISLITINAGNITTNINLAGTTFRDIGPTDPGGAVAADYGPILNMRLYSGGVMNVDGGTAGVTFLGNHALGGSSGVVGVYSDNTMNFTGKVTFDSNWTAYYGGAMSLYEGAGAKANFNGTTYFTNNHAGLFGGAIDMWGGADTLTFNGPSEFTGNYVYNTANVTAEYPTHPMTYDSRGGAINIGFLSPAGGQASVIFNNSVKFTGNFVIDDTLTHSARGGAVSVYANTSSYNYSIAFNKAVIFDKNYVYANNGGGGYGGAIFYDSSAAVLNIGPGSQLTNNYAQTLGGAIYLSKGTINLNANGDNILFQGNKQGVSFQKIGTGPLWQPVTTTGTPNAVYLDGSGILNLTTTPGNSIQFKDPIASVNTATITVNKEGGGEAIFYGAGLIYDSRYDSAVNGNTNVNGGTFTLTDYVKYGATGSGAFNVNKGGTIQGGGNSTLLGNTINISDGGTLAANGGSFILTANNSVVTMGVGFIKGFGTILTPKISLKGVSTADIGSDSLSNPYTLAMNAEFSDAGTGVNKGSLLKLGSGIFLLNAKSSYTGATSIEAGTLQAGVDDAISTSSSVIINGGSFDLNNKNETVNELSGKGGAITTGTSANTLRLFSGNATPATYLGTISGSGNMTKAGIGTLTLAGAVNLSGVINVQAGNLIKSGNTINAATADISNNAGMVIDSSTGNFGSLNIGKSGSFTTKGTLSINNSVVDTIDTVYLYNTSALNLTAGTVLSTNNIISADATNNIVNIDSSTIKAKSDQNAFLSKFALTNPLKINTGTLTIDSDVYTLASTGVFSGSGDLTKAGAGSLTLYSAQAYNGATTVSAGTLIFMNPHLSNTAKTIIANNATLLLQYNNLTNHTFDHQLVGAGTLQVSLKDNTSPFTFSLNAGNSFTGTVELSNSLFYLSPGQNNVLSNATLQLGSGNKTSVSTGQQSINNIIINGGELDFIATDSSVRAATVNIMSGKITIDPTTITTNANILLQDDGINRTLITAANITGAVTDLSFVDATGTAISNSSTATVQNGAAIGNYSFSLNKDTQNQNLFTSYLLSQLDLQAGKTLTLSGDVITTAGANELKAKLIGTGNLAVNATSSITLNNSNNSYSGSTTVGSGTLILGSNNGLGNTSNLIINSGATADINGKNQSVGALNGAGTLAINSGALVVTTGGNFAGSITGTVGTFDLTGSTPLVLTGNNSYRGATFVNSGAEMQIGNSNTSSATYAGDILNNGKVNFNTANYTYLGAISGSGELVKNNSSTLTISTTNSYSGGTTISGGTLSVLNLKALGSGNVLNNKTLSFDLDDINSGTFSQVISGLGSVVKNFSGKLTLDSSNSYSGGTTVSSGTVVAANANAFGSGAVANSASVDLDFSSAANTISNSFSGTGTLNKIGTGVATLSGSGSIQNSVNVKNGTLDFTQSGVFAVTSDYTTESGATTKIGQSSSLSVNGAFNQNGGAILNVAPGSSTAVTATTADIDQGILSVSSLGGTSPATSSAVVSSTAYTLIHTTDGITGGFATTNIANISGYLLYSGYKTTDNRDYKIGYRLAWTDGGYDYGTGEFNIANQSDKFTVDTVLENQSGTFDHWDGKSLTKLGAGTLVLSAASKYTGKTTVEAGTLQTGVADAFADSSDVILNAGGTIDLNGYHQIANKLSGDGRVTLGGATLSANNSVDNDTAFEGVISGSGTVVKSGAGKLTLSGVNDYSGGTTVAAGTLALTNGNATGDGVVNNTSTLELAFIKDAVFANKLAGTGTLNKIGDGVATLTAIGSSQQNVNVAAGKLALVQIGQFITNANHTTANSATTLLNYNSSLKVGGTFKQDAGAKLELTMLASSTAAYVTAGAVKLNGELVINGFTDKATPLRASDVDATRYLIVQSDTVIEGDFSNHKIDGTIETGIDYLINYAGSISSKKNYEILFDIAWCTYKREYATGTFTLPAGTAFDLDIPLRDDNDFFDNIPSKLGWNGRDLTKKGLGTLIFSKSNINTYFDSNRYTGITGVEAGTLRTDTANAFTLSSDIIVSSGAKLDLNNNNQIANKLAGEGSVTLGSATLTANNGIDKNSTFSGSISGTGALVKDGAGKLTLNGSNSYSGGTTIIAGTLAVTNSSAVGAGSINNGATLQLDFAADTTFATQLGGAGTLDKTGLGTATLTSANSSQKVVNVTAGTLDLSKTAAFKADDSYTTVKDATTALGSSKLTVGGAFTQKSGSTLTLKADSSPNITADTADISGSNLVVSGFNEGMASLKSSTITQNEYVVIKTANGISGDFIQPIAGTTLIGLDYLTESGHLANNNRNYVLGFNMAWTDGGQSQATGSFTIKDQAEAFEVDTVLADNRQFDNGNLSDNRWNGKDLTKKGLGTLILSKSNSYSGITSVEAGTLRTDTANAFAASSDLIVSSGATADLNNNNQIANKLAGEGSVTLGSATLTASNSSDKNSTFSGSISGTGILVKDGAGKLTLNGSNSYSGGTTIIAGTLAVTNGSAVGAGSINNGATLQLDFAADTTFANQLGGAGTLDKTGLGTATLTSANSSQKVVNVTAGTLDLSKAATFKADDSYTTVKDATTALGSSKLIVGGAFTQKSGSTLTLKADSSPNITADTADISGSNLVVSGFNETLTGTKSSTIAQNEYVVMKTDNGISGAFVNPISGVSGSGLDYLIQHGHLANSDKDYVLGFQMAWTAGGQAGGTGDFTLADTADRFEVDNVLGDQSGTFNGWNGKDLTKKGAGTLTLSAANDYSGITNVNHGTLALVGTGSISKSGNVVVDGVLDISSVTGSVGTFDESGNAIAKNGTAVQNLSGAQSGLIKSGDNTLLVNNSSETIYNGNFATTSGLIKTGAGNLILGGAELYSGDTHLDAGQLTISGATLNSDIIGQSGTKMRLTNNAVLNGKIDPTDLAVDAGSIWNIRADSIVSNLNLSGTINFAVPVGAFTTGRTLTTSNLIGNGGTISLYTFLGDDSSTSDKIIIDGGKASGITYLKINPTNSGGQLGAATSGNGISIVQAINGATTEAEAFKLNGTKNKLDAGAYSYTLVRSAKDGSAVEDWFLTSQENSSPRPNPENVYNPQVSLYSTIADQTIRYTEASIGTLSDRIGAIMENQTNKDNFIWGRVIGSGIRNNGAKNGIYSGDAKSEINMSGIQAGADLLVNSTGSGDRTSFGIYGTYGSSNSFVYHYSTSGTQRAGKNNMDAYSVGAYLTHISAKGVYIETLIQGSRYSITTNNSADKKISSNNGLGFAASIEAGKQFETGRTGLTIEPQAQVIWQNNQFNNTKFVDVDSGTVSKVSFDRNNSFMLRGSARLASSWQTESKQNISVWFTPGLYYNIGSDPKTSFSVVGGQSATVNSKLSGFKIGAVAGFEGQVSKNIQLNAKVGGDSSVDKSNSYSYSGQVGIKFSF